MFRRLQTTLLGLLVFCATGSPARALAAFEDGPAGADSLAWPSPPDPRRPPPPSIVGLESAAGYGLADFRTVDWAARIDSTWGASVLSVAEMLSLFDAFWGEADRRFACFQGLEVDWGALRSRYTAEIADGVSRGRFTAIMNHLSAALQESHTMALDTEVNQSTPLLPGVPLLVAGIYGDNGHFGAGLTPLADSTLLVYSAVSPHPLGLVPGDIVLGYDGVLWKDIYPQLLREELPITYGRLGSSPSSIRHCWMMSAGMNWHLFSTIDVVKHRGRGGEEGDTLHLSLEPLIGQHMALYCSEQLDVPGVSKPDIDHNDTVSWGIIEGTDIGYIYLYKLRYDFEQQFYNAVDSLMAHHETSGLILDFRLNFGGTLDFYFPALELLFNETVQTIGFGYRCVPGDHLLLCPASQYGVDRNTIHGDPNTFYGKPIAVLTGPGAVSSGDIGPFMLTYHPMVRVFGRPSCGAFNFPFSIEPGPPAPWSIRYARYEAYPADDPSHHLTHDEFPIDEEVWLTRQDVSRGVDTVVEAAVRWIGSTTGAAPGPRPDWVDLLLSRPNPFTGGTAITYRLPAPILTDLAIYTVSGRLVRMLQPAEISTAGEHTRFWDGRDEEGRPGGSGVYLARLRAGEAVLSRRLVRVQR